MTTPRVYIICVASYSEGKVHGAWFDANVSADELQAGIDAMLKRSPAENAEEWRLYDFSGFGKAQIWSNVVRITDFAALIVDLKNQYPAPAISYALDYGGASPSEFRWMLEIDWEGVAQDMALNGELYEVRKNGYSYIFVC